MTRTFTTTLVGAAAMLALAVTACKKEENKGPGAAGGAGGGAGPVPAQTGFAVFPASSKMIFGVSLTSARSSALWGMYKDQVEAAMTKEFAEFKTNCGFDPFSQLQTVVVGGDPDAKELVIVAKGIQREQIKTCGQKMASQKGKKFVVTDEGNLAQYEIDNEKVWGAWLDASTIVLSPEKDKAYVTQRAAGQAGLGDSAEVMSLLKNVDTSATFYLVSTADAWANSGQAGEMIKGTMKGAKGIFASIKLTDGLSLDAGVRFDTAENAKTFTATAQSQLDMAKGQQMPPQLAGLTQAIEKAKISQNGNDTIIQLQLTNEQLKQLASFFMQMSQAFGGMAGAAGGAPGGDTAKPAQ
jgi:hypothetical protein